MLQLLEDNIENEILDSKRIIDEINSMSTTVSYRDFDPKDYIILDDGNGKKVLHRIFKKRY